MKNVILKIINVDLGTLYIKTYVTYFDIDFPISA